MSLSINPFQMKINDWFRDQTVTVWPAGLFFWDSSLMRLCSPPPHSNTHIYRIVQWLPVPPTQPNGSTLYTDANAFHTGYSLAKGCNSNLVSFFYSLWYRGVGIIHNQWFHSLRNPRGKRTPQMEKLLLDHFQEETQTRLLLVKLWIKHLKTAKLWILIKCEKTI